MFTLVNNRGVSFYKSSLLRSKHAFSTRLGGISELEHTKELNLAFNLGDSHLTVLFNLQRFANAVGVEANYIVSVPQVHSNEIRLIEKRQAGAGYNKHVLFTCDGYVTQEKDIPLGVKTADCVPILLEARDDNGKVMAVSAVHAGWRGTALRISEEAVEKLCSLGAKKENIYAAIGPAIDVCCYEGGEDFANEIKTKLGQNYEVNFIKRIENGKLFANIKGMNFDILTSCGVPRENIDMCSLCTCCNPDLFYSHRRQKGVRGSMLSIICK